MSLKDGIGITTFHAVACNSFYWIDDLLDAVLSSNDDDVMLVLQC